MRYAIRLLLGSLLLCWVASARAELVADPVDLEFGTVAIGLTSEPLYMSLRNTGNTSLTVVDLWSPPAGGSFARAGGTCGAVPFTLAAQASCTLGYTFTPVFDAPITHTLRATPNIGSFVTFRLVGEGDVGGLSAGPSLFFGLHALGDTAGPRYLSLSNTSAASLTVVSVTPASGPFNPYTRVGGTCGTPPFTLAAQASCTLGYTFTPNSVGKIYWDYTAVPDVGEVARFTLAGEGGRSFLRTSPRSYLFLAEIPIGGISNEMTVTLENPGEVRLQVTAIAPFGNPPVVPFVRTGGSCAEAPFTLGARSSCTVGYSFAPVAAGEVEMDIQFHQPSSSPETLTLYGTGLPLDEIFADGFDEL